ncbi:cytochrome P450 [Hypoxylon trugodes]|uniref:cytochrome P450 n=1 Tax=Hypoxylon trugodes TaxID=326681 RepID=UPI00218F7C92|nr:cytochrome P450 [Hypoxylon trugodes]KAI1387694.1 cytochrome P450 [Hypoxylon trugodes]
MAMLLPQENQPIAWVALAIFSGVFSHRFYFIKGEHHLKAPIYFRSLLALIILFFTPPAKEFLSQRLGLRQPFLFLFSYLASLFTSITIYRIYFHPTRYYPGPRLAVISKLWHSWLCRGSQNHKVLDVWHEKYGEFIRTGPNEITVFHPEGLEILHGPQSTCSKADWYDVLWPHVALNSIRDKPEHDMRRKTWNPSFSKEALSDYDVAYQKHNIRFEGVIREHNGQKVNIVDLIYYWSFDVMGEITFSKSFETLTDDHARGRQKIIRYFMRYLGPCSPSPWLVNLGSSVPGVMGSWNGMLKMCTNYMTERIEGKTTKSDIASKVATYIQDPHHLGGEALAMIIAGSDTLACTLVYALFYLAKVPHYQDLLLEELRKYNVLGDQQFSPARLQSLPFLNGIINETLRLHNPVPGGLPRIAGPEGLTIAGKYIPPFTTVVAPRYHIARLPSCFYNPDQFDPFRWIHKNKGSHDLRAFVPFSIGRYSCVGRELSLRQARVFLSTIVSTFKIRFADGEDGIAVERDMVDEFTAFPGPLWLQFEARV